MPSKLGDTFSYEDTTAPPAAPVVPALRVTPARALAAALAAANSRACSGRYPIGGRIPPRVGASALAGKSTGTPAGGAADTAAPAPDPKDTTEASAKLALAIYDLQSVDVLQSAPYLAIGYANPSPWTRRLMPKCRRILRFVGEQETGAGLHPV